MIQPLRLEIPAEISTERLKLRIPRSGDGAIIVDSILASLEELKPWLPWATDSYDIHSAEDWCRRAAAAFMLGEQANYLIFHRDTSRYLGNVSSFSKDWRVPSFEIGYWLATVAVGNGYMTEAVRAVTRMTFENFKANRIMIRADLQNARSGRVAERAGYVLEGILKNECRTNDHLSDTQLYVVTRIAGP